MIHKTAFILNIRAILLLSLSLSLSPALAHAQSIGLGADFVSRYVWRGADFGDSFSVQPSLSVSAGGFEIGSWASYSVSADGALANEHDLWISYTIETENSGSISFGVTDYYFPVTDPVTGEQLKFFDFDGGGEGSHLLEPYLSYSAPEAFPITIYAAIMAHNDTDNSLYIEGSIPFDVRGTAMGFAVGMATGPSDLYSVNSTSIINLTLSAEQEIKISDTFSIPISGAYILNPTQERSFLVFGFSLGI